MRHGLPSTICALLLVAFVLPAGAAMTSPIRPVSTYSIVARDAKTGEMGVALQSHWFSVGPTVAWAEAGVGAVATQSFVNVSYGPLGLDAMRAGKTPVEALRALLAQDPGREVRQVALVDAAGRVAAHTGDQCIPGAGHLTGDGYSVQANLMLTDEVPGAMAEAFETTEGPLAERMLAALKAAQRATNPGATVSSTYVSRTIPFPWRNSNACSDCTEPMS